MPVGPAPGARRVPLRPVRRPAICLQRATLVGAGPGRIDIDRMVRGCPMSVARVVARPARLRDRAADPHAAGGARGAALINPIPRGRSEGRRAGQEGVSTVESWWSRVNLK